MSTNILEDGDVVVTRMVGPQGRSYQVTVGSGPMRGAYATLPLAAAVRAARAILADAEYARAALGGEDG